MTTGDKKTIFRFLGLLKKYRGKIVFLMLALLCSIFLSLFSPILSRKLMDDGLMKRDFKVNPQDDIDLICFSADFNFTFFMD